MSAKVKVVCDGCGRHVLENPFTRDALFMMRSRLGRVGWHYDKNRSRDLCPECWKKRQGGRNARVPAM